MSETVAKLRLPIPVYGIGDVIAGLTRIYGDGLRVRQEGEWLCVFMEPDELPSIEELIDQRTVTEDTDSGWKA